MTPPSSALLARLLAAVAASAALTGCPPERRPPPAAPAPPTTATPPPDEPPDEPPPAPVPPAPVPPAPPTTGQRTTRPSPSPEPPDNSRIPRPDDCRATVQHCAVPFEPPTGRQIASSTPDPFDAHGCLPRSLVGNTCNGMLALEGATFRGGKCCYPVCQRQPAPCGRPLEIARQPTWSPPRPRADWT